MSSNVGAEFLGLTEFRNRQASASTAPATVSPAALIGGSDARELAGVTSVEMATQPKVAPSGAGAGSGTGAAVLRAMGEITRDAGDPRFLVALQTTQTSTTVDCRALTAPATRSTSRAPTGAASTTFAGDDEADAGFRVPQPAAPREVLGETEPGSPLGLPQHSEFAALDVDASMSDDADFFAGVF